MTDQRYTISKTYVPHHLKKKSNRSDGTYAELLINFFHKLLTEFCEEERIIDNWNYRKLRHLLMY